jgi:predicted nucleic acid-binding protein
MVRIVDASVAIKWFVEEPGRDRALELLGEILSKPRNFAVPELFFSELVHVFHRTLPNASETQLALLERVLVLGIPRFGMTPDLFRATRKMQTLGLSGYDASYVGLASLLGGRWVTFDRKAHSLAEPLTLSELLE